LALGMLGAALGESAAAASGTDPAPGMVIPATEGTGSPQSQRGSDFASPAPQEAALAPDGSTPGTRQLDPLVSPLNPYDGQLRISFATHSDADLVCYGAEGVVTGWTTSYCTNIPSTNNIREVGVPYGDSYRIWAYEENPDTGRRTDYIYLNNTGADSRLRTNATAYPAFSVDVYWWTITPLSFRLDLKPWLGTNTSTNLDMTSSVYPLYVGAVTTLTATFTGNAGTPSGVVEFYDDRGAFLGDRVLSGGVASIQYTVTHAAPSLVEVDYRGNGTYAPLYWELSPDFLPTIDKISPGYGPTAGGTPVTIRGYALTDVTSVTFGGVEGTSLNVVHDTQLKVATPAGVDATAPVVLHTASGSSHWTKDQFFAYTDGSVMAGIPAGVVDVSNFTPGVVRCYQVAGRGGVPWGAVGVTLNVTASLPNAPGHVRIYPDSSNYGFTLPPAVSTVNFEVGRDVANSTTISLPWGGKVCAYGVGGTLSRLILDVEGYTLPGSGITLITPEKLIDTRSQPWYHVGSINGPVQPMTDYKVQVGGVGTVPADAVAVIANITVVDTNFPGHLRMWASDQDMPNTSVVNYAPETKANSQIVALSADGEITFRSFSWAPTTMSPVQVLIDVTGYITAGSDFTATTPTKIVETRPAYGIVGPISGALTPGVVYPVPVDTSVVPAGATAVVLNVTAVQPTNIGHIRVYPDTNGVGTTTPPNTSNLNFIPGRDIPNMVIVQLPEDRTIDFYTAYAGFGSTDLVVNIIGYVTAPAG